MDETSDSDPYEGFVPDLTCEDDNASNPEEHCPCEHDCCNCGSNNIDNETVYEVYEANSYICPRENDGVLVKSNPKLR